MTVERFRGRTRFWLGDARGRRAGARPPAPSCSRGRRNPEPFARAPARANVARGGPLSRRRRRAPRGLARGEPRDGPASRARTSGQRAYAFREGRVCRKQCGDSVWRPGVRPGWSVGTVQLIPSIVRPGQRYGLLAGSCMAARGRRPGGRFSASIRTADGADDWRRKSIMFGLMVGTTICFGTRAIGSRCVCRVIRGKRPRKFEARDTDLSASAYSPGGGGWIG